MSGVEHSFLSFLDLSKIERSFLLAKPLFRMGSKGMLSGGNSPAYKAAKYPFLKGILLSHSSPYLPSCEAGMRSRNAKGDDTERCKMG